MKQLGNFWRIYMFFFIVPFPMFLYYTIHWFGPGRFARLTNPYLALTWLGLSVFLWALILLALFRKWKLTRPDSKGYFSRLLGWALIVGAVSGYYVFSYNLESNGTGWRFLMFWHPLIIIPLGILFYSFVFSRVFNMLGKIMGGISSKELDERGIDTRASVVSAHQTGLYINNQPQVLFELEFKDQTGNLHRVKHKQIVTLLNLGIASQGTLPITYLPENPQKIKIHVSPSRV